MTETICDSDLSWDHEDVCRDMVMQTLIKPEFTGAEEFVLIRKDAGWGSMPITLAEKVATVSTDGFLYSKEVLIDRRLMDRKGFPESYDRTALLSFLSRVSRGEARLPVPGYSHDLYDVVDIGQTLGPDVSIVILEGLNILQDPGTVLDQLDNAWVRSYLAFSLFLDADEADLRRWYIQRSMKLRSAGEPAVKDGDPRKGRSTALRRLEERWTKINAVNLAENILPSRINADMVIRLGEEHDVIGVALARLDRNGRIFDLGRQSLECSNYV